jgi:hypothetical protein
MQRDKSNAKMFDKEPHILFKMDPNHYDYDKNLDCSHKHGEDVALRRRPKQTDS